MARSRPPGCGHAPVHARPKPGSDVSGAGAGTAFHAEVNGPGDPAKAEPARHGPGAVGRAPSCRGRVHSIVVHVGGPHNRWRVPRIRVAAPTNAEPATVCDGYMTAASDSRSRRTSSKSPIRASRNTRTECPIRVRSALPRPIGSSVRATRLAGQLPARVRERTRVTALWGCDPALGHPRRDSQATFTRT
jgi:hypothetical protein